MSNEDIRDRIEKDCIETWQKATIRDALPEEYKDKLKVEQGKKGREKQLVAPTIGKYVGKTENQPDESRAKDHSIEQKETDSESFKREPEPLQNKPMWPRRLIIHLNRFKPEYLNPYSAILLELNDDGSINWEKTKAMRSG